MKGLVIRSPWIDLILAGRKTWEMRTRPTSTRGQIALIKAGSGMVYGFAEIRECLPALSREQLTMTKEFHGIPEDQIDQAIANRWTTPWVLGAVTRLDSPIPYRHRSGAVTWVDLGELFAGKSPAVQGAKESIEIKPKMPSPKATSPVSDGPRDKPTKSASGVTSVWADVLLSDGNIRNGHFYLRSAERLLPPDCIGGPNKATAATNIRVRFDPGMQIETDIAGDKMILRARGPIRDFFDRTGAKPGDNVRFERVGDRDFLITLRRAGT